MLPETPIADAPPRQRRPYRVPMGLPVRVQNWRSSSAFAVAVHLIIAVLLISPFAVSTNVFEVPQGAGRPGPAGGGGGGTMGSGRINAEMIQYVQPAPPPPPPTQPQVRVETPPPVLPKPEVIPPPQPVLEAPKPVEVTTAPVGVGGGTGADGTAGSGPGTGGGVGTGVGTGRGSSVGPGTGGGGEANYPPTATEIILPPIPVPSKLKGQKVLVEFDIDDRGRVLSVAFGDTGDRGYNSRLRDQLRGYRFKPGHRPDGTPIRMKYQMEIFF